MGDARGIGRAVRNDVVSVLAAALFGVWAPGRALLMPVPSSDDGSGVVGRDVCALKLGRRRDVRDGDGGRGVGGRL